MPTRMPESHRVRGSRRIRCLIANVRAFDTLTCVYCKSELTTDNIPFIDHIIPRSQDGHLTHPDNLVVCCGPCNGRKGITNVVDVFGLDIAANVYHHINTRRLTEGDWQASIEIHKAAGDRTNATIEMVYDWVHLGLLPM